MKTVHEVAEQELPRLTTTTLPLGVDSVNPFDEMMSRFDVAAQKLGLDPEAFSRPGGWRYQGRAENMFPPR